MVLYISDSKLTPRSFYNYLLVQLGCKPVLHRNAARDSLHRQIEIMRSMQNRKAVVIVDEAHLLDLLENGELDEMTRDEITMYMLDILDRYEFPHPIRNLEDFRILHYVPF